MTGVLITSAGRRHYLVGYFRQALQAVGGVVVAADASPYAPALVAADVPAVVPPFDSDDYVPALLDLVRAHDVGLLLCVHDYDALVVAKQLPAFEALGCLALVSTPDVVDLVADKLKLRDVCAAVGLGYPETVPTVDEVATLPGVGAVVKPRFGSASMGLALLDERRDTGPAVATTRAALQRAFPGGEATGFHDVLVQERVEGIELGVDVVNSPDRRTVAVLARRKLAMRGGETDKAVTVAVDERLREFAYRLGRTVGHVGCLDCDVVDDGDRLVLLDANARFGGGYPFVHEAGADLPRAFVAWARGEEPAPSWFRYAPDVVGMKCDRVVTTVVG